MNINALFKISDIDALNLKKWYIDAVSMRIRILMSLILKNGIVMLLL